jgi:hypothetical protein
MRERRDALNSVSTGRARTDRPAASGISLMRYGLTIRIDLAGT